MMLSPDARQLFVEIPKTGSTAATKWLHKHGWFQNGSMGTGRIPGTATGRHAYHTETSKAWAEEHEVTTYAVVRNPWDRIESVWRQSETRMSWDQFMVSGRFKHGNVDILSMTLTDWTFGVDHVLRYETLTRDWNDCINLPVCPLDGFPRFNAAKREARAEWRPEQIEKVRQTFAPDVERWGWKGPSSV